MKINATARATFLITVDAGRYCGRLSLSLGVLGVVGVAGEAGALGLLCLFCLEVMLLECQYYLLLKCFW